MKRIGDVFDRICSMENLLLADKRARKGKGRQEGIRIFDRNKNEKLLQLQQMLLNGTYRTSPYTTFTVWKPKERVIWRLPYFPDRILHHAIMNILESFFVRTFTKDTYSCIKKRGLHKAQRNLRKALYNEKQTQYGLQIDIIKFYPSVDHTILKRLLRRKIKDKRLLWLLDEIIDSAPGLPIGNYLSQYLANFYLTYFDHWIKEVEKIAHYFRYADDMLALSATKERLHQLFIRIKNYLWDNLRLKVKGNWKVFPITNEVGANMLGYITFRDYTLIRPEIKYRFIRMLSRNPNHQSISSYLGWFKWGNCIHLQNKLLNDYAIQKS